MPDNYDRLHEIVKEDLTARGETADPELLYFMESVGQLREGEAKPENTRSAEVDVASDGRYAGARYRDPYVLLRLNINELTDLVTGTLKDVGVLAVNGKLLNVPKAAYAITGLIRRYRNAMTHEFHEADGKVLLAIARVDQRQVTKAAVKQAYNELFGEALTDDHYLNAIENLSGFDFLYKTGRESVRLNENVVLRRV